MESYKEIGNIFVLMLVIKVKVKEWNKSNGPNITKRITTESVNKI